MLVSLQVTHSSAGSAVIADVIPKMEKGADDFIKGLSGVDEYLILRTCNRFEIYISTNDTERIKNELESYARTKVPHSGESVWYTLTDGQCIKHLFRVTCGLDSLVIGEDQIQSQVKNAYTKAKDEGHVSTVLTTVFEKALYTGKRVRTETELNSGAISVGSAAVQLAEKKLGGLSGKTVAIIGAGDMATVIAKYLRGKGPNAIFVSNRTFDHARVLANEVGGHAVNYSEVKGVLASSDLAIVATNAPHVLIDRDMIKEVTANRASKLLIIDISVPRNVANDVDFIDNVEVDSMAEISEVAQENLMSRRNEMVHAERIVRTEIENIDIEMKGRRADETISCIVKRSSDIRKAELDRAITKIKAGGDLEEVLDDMSRAMVSKLLAKPFNRLKEASRDGRTDYCEVASDLFGVDGQ